MKRISPIIFILLLFSCSQKQQVDLLVTNANIYTVNENFDQAEAFVAKDGNESWSIFGEIHLERTK